MKRKKWAAKLLKQGELKNKVIKEDFPLVGYGKCIVCKKDIMNIHQLCYTSRHGILTGEDKVKIVCINCSIK